MEGAGGRSCFISGTKIETDRNIVEIFIGSLAGCRHPCFIPYKELLQSLETLPVNEATNYWIMSLCKHCPASPLAFHHLPFSIASGSLNSLRVFPSQWLCSTNWIGKLWRGGSEAI